MRSPLLSSTLALVALLVGWSSTRAQTGATFTPDRRTFLISKDLPGPNGPDRYTISANLATPGDLESVTSFAGNVFRPDGGPASFLHCGVRPDSKGSLSDPNSIFLLSCAGADACPTSARTCARESWRPIPGSPSRVELPASFFLPLPRDTTAAASAVPRTARVSGGGPAGRGATLSTDGRIALVSKDQSGNRWSVEVILQTQNREDVGARVQSVTGNVFPAAGGSPTFLFCTPRSDNAGSLEQPESKFRLSCMVDEACTDGVACADGWQPLDDADVAPVPASFFLPPRGLPARPLSDDGIYTIGVRGDPPSYAVSGVSGTSTIGLPAAKWAFSVLGTECSGRCTIDRFGECKDLPGTRTLQTNGVCACQLDSVDLDCVECGDLARDGTCGGDCQFAVGSSGQLARGTCVPVSANSSTCACVATGFNGASAIRTCTADDRSACSAQECCVDDPRDGCDPDDGSFTCPGICAPSDSVEARLCLGTEDYGIGVDASDARCNAPQCEFVFCGTELDGQCPLEFRGTGDGCDCGCGFEDPDCDFDPLLPDPTDPRCSDSRCDFIFCGTEFDDACSLEFQGTGDGCDCGCQFADPDCNAPVTPDFDDPRCAPAVCDYAFCGTDLDNNCSLDFNGTGDGCDCGCQFDDPDCNVRPQTDPRCTDPVCDFSFCGGDFDNACPTEWNGAGDGCDCGCQFQDADCAASPPPPSACDAECDFCVLGTDAENDCPAEWNGTGDGCDCGCQFSDPDCSGVLPDPGDPRCSAASCEFLHCGTQLDDNCPASFNGTGDGCDCGCQFQDADCTTPTACTAQCEFCLLGTEFENDCPLEFDGDGECDCGCQFQDSDCGS